jgi:hypothetical protein
MITQSVKLNAEIIITLNESEARAIEALFGYSHEDFINFFYKNLGTHYLKPHESGLRSLMKAVNLSIPYELSKLDKARKILSEAKDGQN